MWIFKSRYAKGPKKIKNKNQKQDTLKLKYRVETEATTLSERVDNIDLEFSNKFEEF